MLLVQAIFDTLIERVTKISNLDQASQAWQQTLNTQVIMPDGTWPYLIWNHTTSKLEVNQKQRGLSMTTLMDLLTSKREHLRRPLSIQRTQALRPPVSGGTVPWKTQIGLRETELYDLLYKVAHCSAWQLLQMTMQPHNAKRCNNANSTAKGKASKKGKGKGKSKP